MTTADRIRSATAADVENWIETFCIEPFGANQGQKVRLLAGHRKTIRTILGPDGPNPEYTIADMALRAYLALAWLCGPLADAQSRPKLDDVDSLVVWCSAGRKVRAVLERDDAGVITCGELGTRYPAEAAEA